jgi:hypothetical protein
MKRPVITLTIGVATVGVLLAAVFALGRIPLIEGDQVITHGSGYGFMIGMAKPDALRVLQSRYARTGNDVRVVWEKSAPIDSRLARYENTELKDYGAREHGEHRIAVSSLKRLSEPLTLCDVWRLETPAQWVNDIYLTFRNDHLVKIERSRWLFERP